MYIKVCIAQYHDAVFFYLFCAIEIIAYSTIFLVMLVAVQFNNQSCFRTKEVNDI